MSLLRLATRQAGARRMMSTEIPIKHVARVYRMHVDGEADALKVDAIIKDNMPKIKTVPGFVSFQRRVCKSEWACDPREAWNRGPNK